ncbi:MAG: serine/threonine-protein kinase [Planctomycetes bacterium]|nr:serine/threonine-protein kinase [Planctomycetota bacterium]
MTDDRAASDPGTSDDEALLDALLDRVVRDFSDGRAVDPALLLPERPDLRFRVVEIVEIAREIAPRRPPERPTFAGYEIVRELGRGGMGQVLLARHRKLGRTVALKVLPRRLAAGKARDRFQREARAVARLQHPLIVPIYDLGEDDGQPFFTMAYVEGGTLASAIHAVRGRDPAALTGADFARGAGFAGTPPERWAGAWTRAAVQAVIDVADALSYAHGLGVVHRDVKPSNVLLRRDGFALLFDFGLASVDDEATLTLTHGFVGTPHYASPEQAAGETSSLDAQSDVFSLGATLYEALTLELPFPGPTTHEVLRRIQTWEPEPPSARNAGVSKDLETVILAALEKDRAKRYATAAAFADDLRAALDGKRVRAKRAGLLERGLRSVKRGRALTDLLVEQQARNAELRALVLRAEREEAAARAAQERAEEERRRADDEARKSREESARVRTVLSFLEDALSSADPSISGRDVRVADVLTSAALRARQSLDADPALRLSVERAIVSTLVGLGLYSEGLELARDAHTRATSALDADDPLRIEWETTYGQTLWESGDIEAALGPLGRALESSERVFGPEHPATARCLGDYGQGLSDAGRMPEAEGVLRRALDVSTRVLGADDPATLLVTHNLGFLLSRGARRDEALDVLRAAWESRRRALGVAHPDTLMSCMMYGQTLKEAGRLAEAEPVLRAAYDGGRERLGPDHPSALIAEHNLCGVLLDLGRAAEAVSAQRHVAEASVRTLGEDSYHARFALAQLGRVLMAAEGPTEETLSVARRAVAAWIKAEPSGGRSRSAAEELLAAALRGGA